MYIGLRVQFQSFLPDFKDKGIFSTHFRKNTQISNFIKIHPEGAELFHADGGTDRRTDMMELIVAFAILRMCLKSSSVIIPYMVPSFIIPKFVNNLSL